MGLDPNWWGAIAGENCIKMVWELFIPLITSLLFPIKAIDCWKDWCWAFIQSFIFANYACNLKALSMFLQWECPRRAMCSAKLLHDVIRVFELHLGFPFCAINLLHLIPVVQQGIEPDSSLWCGREYRTSRGQLFDTVEEGGLRASAPYVSSTEIAEQENEHGLDILHDRVNVLKRV